jgi:3-phosphoshikimate 1-carboxyvinyltransferase
MPDPVPIARPLTALRCRGLKGRFRVPGDPSITALTLMLAALARGETVVLADTSAPVPDVAATFRLVAELGAVTERHDDRWQINGLGARGLLAPEQTLEFDGAGRALQLAMGLLAPYDFSARLEARGASMPPRPLLEALRALGVDIAEQRTGQLPLTLRGPRMAVPFDWRLPALADSIAVEAMLLAALGLPGVSRLAAVAPWPDHAVRLLRHFGAEIAERATDHGTDLEIGGLPALGARTLTPAGDPDIAALAIVAALTVPDSDVVVENVMLNPARAGVLAALTEMGGSIERLDRRHAAGEEVADLRVRHSALLGVRVNGAGLTAGGLAPLAVAGAFAAGETRIPRLGLPEEADLHRALATALSLNGAAARADADGLTVGRPRPGTRLGGSTVEAGRDSRLAAAMLVFGLAAAERVTLADDTRMRLAFPEFVGSLEALGAQFYRRSP